jgi:hypothetical protein
MKTLLEKHAVMSAAICGEKIRKTLRKTGVELKFDIHQEIWDWYNHDFDVVIPAPKTAKLPDGLGWWVRNEAGGVYLPVAIVGGSFQIVAVSGSHQYSVIDAADCKFTWTRDGVKWFNFYGEKVK